MTSISIPLCVPSVGPEEMELLGRCIDDNFVSSVGPFVSEFEQRFAEFMGITHAVAMSSGTAALHIAMIVNGIGPGDLVAVSDFTFIASANAIRYAGADALLVDSEPESWNLDGEMLYDEVRRRAARGLRLPVAIEAVHVLGQPARLEPLIAICEEFGARLIEDAAESLGASYTSGALAGRQVGTVGSVGAFSFNGNKIITTGSGGMLVTSDPDLAARARHLSTQAKLDGPNYVHDEVGFNYRMSNVTAAIGVAQLKKLPRFLERKHQIAHRYGELLDPALFSAPPTTSFGASSSWLHTVRCDPSHRDQLIAELAASGIQARTVWPPLRSQAPFRSSETIGEGVGDQIYRSAVSLPSSVDLQDESIAEVARVANAALRAAVR